MAPNHTHCQFPLNIANPNDTVRLSLGGLNERENYFDVLMDNPSDFVLAYEFALDGITIEKVENLYLDNEHDINLGFSSDGKIAGLPVKETPIWKNAQPKNWLRVYYKSPAQGQTLTACIDNITVIVNSSYEEVVTKIEGDCLNVTNVVGNPTEEPPVGGVDIEALPPFSVQLFPNPFHQFAKLNIEGEGNEVCTVKITDLGGKVKKSFTTLEKEIQLDGQELEVGIYLLSVETGNKRYTTKIVVY